MKKLSIIILAAVSSIAAIAQDDKTYSFTTKSKGDDLVSYEVNEKSNEIKLLFVKKGRKADVYDNYVFDTDLKLITTSEEELEKEKAKSKFTFWDALEEQTVAGNTQVLKDNLLTVENNAVGQMVIKKGYIGMNTNTNPISGKKQTSVGFVATEKAKAKSEDNRKLGMMAFRTDMPSEQFNATFTTGNGRSIGGGQKVLSEASGDLLVIATLLQHNVDGPNGKEVVDACIKYVAMKFSATSLDKIAESPFEFQYHSEILYQQDATDGTNDLLMIFAPAVAPKRFANPNRKDYIYVRVSRNAEIKEQVSFESPFFRMNSVSINQVNGSTYIVSTGDSKEKEKYFPLVKFSNEDDQLAVIKLNGKSVEYTTITPVADLAKSFSGVDKVKPFAGAGFQAAEFKLLSDNSFFITGQEYKLGGDLKKTYGDFYGFHIGPDGKIKRHFAVARKEDNGPSESTVASQIVVPASSDNSFFWTMLEYNKKSNAYPKYVLVDTKVGAIGNVTVPGNAEYFVNDNFPAYFYKDKKEMFFFGNTGDGKQLWLHKVKF